MVFTLWFPTQKKEALKLQINKSYASFLSRVLYSNVNIKGILYVCMYDLLYFNILLSILIS